ncbi:hypothetical protein [Streptomyces sp. NPDC058424]|uniref:hypothetical protein n=1 Tax=Streptomyces sp. NPDC058424 TaxID=3346491 RepID=UPI003651D71E
MLLVYELVNSGGDRLVLGGDGGRPTVPRFGHRTEHGREFGHHHVQDDHVHRGPDGFGDQAARQVLRTFKCAALGVEAEAGNVDGPPPVDAAQEDLEFVAGTHGLCLLSFRRLGLLLTD